MTLYLGENKVKLRSSSAITYSVKGSPTISTDGIASGFTDKNDYLTLPVFNPGTSKWKFTTKVKFNSLSTQMSLIDRNSSTRCFQIVMKTNGRWRVNISTNGTSKANEVDGTHTCSANTIYYLSFEYTGTNYVLKYSTDNINWITDITVNNSTKVYGGATLSMGHSWYNSGTEKWDGDIYLRSTHLDVTGNYTDMWKLHCLESGEGSGEPNPPANVIFTSTSDRIYVKSGNSISYYTKTYNGLAYGGFAVFTDGSQNWQLPFMVSEVRDNCAMYRDNNSSIALNISDTAFSYYDKNWYYTKGTNAMPFYGTAAEIDYNLSNGRYWIGGSNTIYSGSDIFKIICHDLLDYVYSF